MRLAIAALVIALPFSALALEPVVPTPDVPIGAPYRTSQAEFRGTMESPVSVRDYLSTRIDALRAEIIAVIDERDKRYAQRFDAQQEALSAALQGAKEAVANALSAAKEAVIKAETAVEKRFESVNEFRATLTDQAANFVSKDSADAKFKSIEDKVAANAGAIAQLDNRIVQLTSRGAGVNDAWVYLVGFVVFVAAAIGIIGFFRRPIGK